MTTTYPDTCPTCHATTGEDCRTPYGAGHPLAGRRHPARGQDPATFHHGPWMDAPEVPGPRACWCGMDPHPCAACRGDSEELTPAAPPRYPLDTYGAGYGAPAPALTDREVGALTTAGVRSGHAILEQADTWHRCDAGDGAGPLLESFRAWTYCREAGAIDSARLSWDGCDWSADCHACGRSFTHRQDIGAPTALTSGL